MVGRLADEGRLGLQSWLVCWLVAVRPIRRALIGCQSVCTSIVASQGARGEAMGPCGLTEASARRGRSDVVVVRALSSSARALALFV